MKIFTYWSNKTEWHCKKLAEITANNILDADKQFEQLTGLNPVKNTWISVTPP